MIITYTGNGKGKTSAALGTVLRAAGYHMSSCIVQFIKDGSQYGEHHAINHHLNDFVEVYQAGIGFYKLPGDEHSETDHKKAADEAIKFAYKMIKSKKYDIIVLDELLTAEMVKLVSEEDVLKIMNSIPESMHLILTGRGASNAIIERSDLVSEMKEIKHPFQKDEPAVEGIDY
ncbi:MAG: cob(I)yrinic acid a,c-diamide adenosyltransferase [Candidatus Marinimicrobia bacterium]|nr:cob(I)yrinic acid a,c-diamide adenosyltransferase [Candidatus Neomarinimicrobiota bacterium]